MNKTLIAVLILALYCTSWADEEYRFVYRQTANEPSKEYVVRAENYTEALYQSAQKCVNNYRKATLTDSEIDRLTSLCANPR